MYTYKLYITATGEDLQLYIAHDKQLNWMHIQVKPIIINIAVF